MTRTDPTIPGFHDDLPDCREASPNGWQTGFCPQECNADCWHQCKNAWNQGECRKKCQTDCMKECLFVPCCTRRTICDNGVQRVRESCRLDYWEGISTSDWKTTGWC
ncbi:MULTISPECIES: hypothetical protein [unclassified Streptomyces]|uniref:hypothetical protein n=1 Tax=unclassified Streptomyces TaxID=2593676 RepID=UPI0033B3FCBA